MGMVRLFWYVWVMKVWICIYVNELVELDWEVVYSSNLIVLGGYYCSMLGCVLLKIWDMV